MTATDGMVRHLPVSSSEGALSSVANAARVLKEFRIDRAELGISELSRRLSIGKSTTHRLVTTLVREQLLEQDASSGLYRLAITVYELGLSVPLLKELHQAATPVVDALRTRTRETVMVGVRRDREVVYTERAESSYGMALFRRLGYRNFVHCTATGKALLAELPSDQLDELLSGWRPPKRTERTITEHAALRMELAKTRTQGYAICLGESDETAASVGATIRSPHGVSLAVLSVVLPLSRLTPTAQRNLGQLVIEGASAISTRLANASAPPRPTRASR